MKRATFVEASFCFEVSCLVFQSAMIASFAIFTGNHSEYVVSTESACEALVCHQVDSMQPALVAGYGIASREAVAAPSVIAASAANTVTDQNGAPEANILVA